ncbi:MAG: hypothetical protein K2L94_04910, partial [Alphaproteobacteria bacterium]|nr:hypothetical protein [Alphaproteobacteria bacterium]
MILGAVATWASPGHAYLRTAGSLSPGDYCNTDCTTMACMLAVKTDIDVSFDTFTYYPDCTDDNTSDTGSTCWLSKTPGNYVLCDMGGESACSLYSASGAIMNSGVHYSAWTTYNSTNHTVQRHKYIMNDSSNYYNCQTTKVVEYGCMANYYTTSSTATASTSCSACPTSDGISGRSAAGNVAITGCYIPSGSTGSNTTGTFIYDGNSYYCN